jgi:DNA polymerase elongation subunit (family B)
MTNDMCITYTATLRLYLDYPDYTNIYIYTSIYGAGREGVPARKIWKGDERERERERGGQGADPQIQLRLEAARAHISHTTLPYPESTDFLG